jgi:uncharacterized glyoxalase superfamily protein PhnB
MPDVKMKSIAPIFQVTNLERALAFYRNALGFDVAWQAGEPPAHAAVCRDDVEISLEVAASPAAAHAYLHVAGVDDLFAGAAAAGAQIVVPLEDRWYGLRDGRIADPDGNQLSLGEETQAK